MEMVGDGCHAARKLCLIHNQVAIVAPLLTPAIVQNDILISQVAKTSLDE